MKAKTKRRGRPPKGSGEAKSEVILVRVDEREKRGFTDAAKLAGAPVSVWIRERLRKIAKTELESSGQPVAFLPARNEV